MARYASLDRINDTRTRQALDRAEQQLPDGISSFFWFPWCTGAYTKSFIDRKAEELKASGRYWAVQKRYAGRDYAGHDYTHAVTFYKLFIKLARDEDGHTIWHRDEWEQHRAKTA